MKMNLSAELATQNVIVKTKKRNWNKKRELTFLLFPILLLFLLFFFVPIVILFYTSFRTFDAVTGIGDTMTLQNYMKFLSDSTYLLILWRTLKIGFITTFVCIVLSYPIAYQMTQMSRRIKNYMTLLVLSPLLISMVIRSYGWGIVLGNTGIVNTILIKMGLINSPISLMYTEFSVVLGMVHVFIPYMILSLTGSLERIDPSIYRASRILGAGSIKTFFSVTLPLSLPGIFAGSVMVFSLAVSSFVTPSILGGSKVKVMSYLTYEQFTNTLNWPYGAAIGFILVFISIITLIAYSRLLRYSKKGVVIQ